MRLVLGLDAGGTSSRAALHTLDGDLVGRGRSGPGNPGAQGSERARANLVDALLQALGPVDPSLVVGCVAGLAGNPARTAETVREALSAVSVPVVADMVGDVVTAFAAGTYEPSGAVLISGTGAIAAKITGHRQTATADGFGWLLGDDGSAFWLGRAATRATLQTLTTTKNNPPLQAPTTSESSPTLPKFATSENGTPSGPMVPALVDSAPVGSEGGAAVPGLAPATNGTPIGAVVSEVAGVEGGTLAGLVVRRLVPGGLGGDPVAEIVAAVHGRPPLALAELAPLVGEAALAGDRVAAGIVAEAARLLVATLASVRVPGLPVVLSGSVLTAEGPVRQAVRELLGDAVTAGDAAGAAAWLAALPFLDRHESRTRHPRFVTP